MKKEEALSIHLFSLSHTMTAPLFKETEYPWEVLSRIKEFILSVGPTLPEDEYGQIGEGVWIHRSVLLPPSASVRGPAIIGPGVQIRHGAFIRENVVIGAGAVFGNSCEAKNCIIFDGVQVPHFNYIGDSVLGYKSHMGAASLTSNVKSDKMPVKIYFRDETVDTGLKKCGAMLGDGVEVGCGAVLNPGVVIGKNSNVYPLSSVRGSIGADSIYKERDKIVKKRR